MKSQVQRLLSTKGTPRLNALLRRSCAPIGLEGNTFVVQARAPLDREQIETSARCIAGTSCVSIVQYHVSDAGMTCRVMAKED
jgi:hypothetical protein